MTCGVASRIEEDPAFATFAQESMARHARGDWGDLCKEDKNANNLSLKDGDRLLSAYEHPTLPKIWIITECDRSATTILFPDEY